VGRGGQEGAQARCRIMRSPERNGRMRDSVGRGRNLNTTTNSSGGGSGGGTNEANLKKGLSGGRTEEQKKC